MTKKKRWMPPIGWPCKICGKTDELLSAKHMCDDCAFDRFTDNIRQLRAKEGPNYERWRKALLLSVS